MSRQWHQFWCITPKIVQVFAVLSFCTTTVFALLPRDSFALYTLSFIGVDKLKHVIAFIILTVLLRAGWPKTVRIYQCVFLLVYGLMLECIQSTTLIGRVFSFFDLVTDILGITLGLILAQFGSKVLQYGSWIRLT